MIRELACQPVQLVKEELREPLVAIQQRLEIVGFVVPVGAGIARLGLAKKKPADAHTESKSLASLMK